MAVPIRSLKLWINAFIPKRVGNYTRPVPGKANKTMIPGPIRGFSDCYYTDQRGFSNRIHAESRMHSELVLTPNGISKQWHHCWPTVECDCGDGDIECKKSGSTARMRYKIKRPPAGGIYPHQFVIDVWLVANNPCSPASRVFGDIDIHGTINVDLVNPRRVELDLKVDAFPAFEAYLSANNGATTTIFRINPPVGNTVGNLPGNASRRVHCELSDRNGDAAFEHYRSISMPKETLPRQ